LTKIETVTSFESRRQNILYTLSLDRNFSPLFKYGVQWVKQSRNALSRGFVDDDDNIPVERRLTGNQKVRMFELMLGQIANFCLIIARSSIVKNSTSVSQIWQTIRLHFGFQSTGAHFIDFIEPNERPEDLFQRIMAFAVQRFKHFASR
jgi:hypothetical protein